MKEIDQVIATAESPDPADGLRAAALLRRLAEQLEARHVTAARVAGWSWQDIGDALGVSRQAVHKKYRRRDNV